MWFESSATSYYIFGSAPATASQTVTLQFTAQLGDYTDSQKTSQLQYPVTNTCANVVITVGDVYENDVITTEVVYE